MNHLGRPDQKWRRNNEPLCVDDYGTAVFTCLYSGELVWAANAVIVGGLIPDVPMTFIMAPTETAKAAQRESARLFHECEANCNTCRHLARVRHPKTPTGWLYWRCDNPQAVKSASPYSGSEVDGVMMFHPHDPMHMPCYEARA